jgi:hypothetical protein
LSYDDSINSQELIDNITLTEMVALNLGASSYEIIHAQFEGYAPEDRQILYDLMHDDLIGETPNEILQELNDMSQIKNDFHLKGG